MSHFNGLSSEVIGIVLVGAEGCSEASDKSWLRDSTEEEKELFRSYCHELFRKANEGNANKRFDFGKFLMDGNGRPYWIKAVLDQPSTPPTARFKAEQFTRVVRIGSD